MSSEPMSKSVPCRPSAPKSAKQVSSRHTVATVQPLTFLSDRRYHPTMETCWAEGYPARAPVEADVCDWRDSARRLARRLGTTVRTGHKDGRAFAVANSGYPLGLSDPNERDEWLRRHADTV